MDPLLASGPFSQGFADGSAPWSRAGVVFHMYEALHGPQEDPRGGANAALLDLDPGASPARAP